VIVMWRWYPGHMGFGAGGWIGMLFMMLFWVLVIVGLVLLVRHLAARRAADDSHRQWTAVQGPATPEPGRPQSSALQILEERYARGEIDQAEFRARRADLTGRP
jgi:putative membrane protein